MEPKIVQKSAFSAVGLKVRGRHEEGELPQLWEVFIPRSREFAHTPVAYGLMGNYDAETGAFDYMAAYEVEGEVEIPAGMERWDVEAATYAVFETSLLAFGETYSFIHGTWWPNAPYRHGDGPEFELYPADYAGKDDSPMYIYVPVVPKEA